MANVVSNVMQFGGPLGINSEPITITPVVSPTVVVGSILFGVGVSVVFSLYPAWRASKLKPVDALRSE